MKRKHVVLAVAAILGLGLSFLAGRAAANSAAFAFTMELRAVNGEKNKKFHSLDAGELTLSGAIWVVSKNRGSTAAPEVVEIKVKKSGLLASEVCSVSLTPNTIFNAKRSFEKSCGKVESGTYWVFVTRPRSDGWHLKGSGSLVTK